MALFGIGGGVRAIIGPTLRRLDHRHLGLAVGLLHQHPARRPWASSSDSCTSPIRPTCGGPRGGWTTGAFLFICLGLGSLEVVLNRASAFDWFESNFIKLFALGAAVGIALFIWRLAHRREAARGLAGVQKSLVRLGQPC